MWIEFSELDFKLLVLLIFPIFITIENYTSALYLKENGSNILFFAFNNFLSYILSFIFLLISRYQSKPKIVEQESKIENEDNNSNNNDLDLNKSLTMNQSLINSKRLSLNKEMINEIDELKKKINKKRKNKGIIYLVLLCAIGLLSHFYRYFFENDKLTFAKQSVGVFFEITFYVSLSYLILKQKLYKHNYTSLIIIAVSLVIIFIISIFYNDGKYIIYSFLYYIFYSLGFSLYDVLEKKYMNDLYQAPYFMMLVIGIVNSFILIIYDVFAYNLNPGISGIIIGFQNNITSAGKFFAYVLDIIVNFIWNLGIWLTVYYFTPCHFFISEYIAEYIKYLIDIRNSESDFYSAGNAIIFSLLYFINFFCFLVFNEVVILNFWNLDYNTKKRIRERMKIDDDYIKKEFPLININLDDSIDDINE